jgi:hypothetical protein
LQLRTETAGWVCKPSLTTRSRRAVDLLAAAAASCSGRSMQRQQSCPATKRRAPTKAELVELNYLSDQESGLVRRGGGASGSGARCCSLRWSMDHRTPAPCWKHTGNPRALPSMTASRASFRSRSFPTSECGGKFACRRTVCMLTTPHHKANRKTTQTTVRFTTLQILCRPTSTKARCGGSRTPRLQPPATRRADSRSRTARRGCAGWGRAGTPGGCRTCCASPRKKVGMVIINRQLGSSLE